MSDQSDVDSDLAREEIAEEDDKPLGMGLSGVPPGCLEVTSVKPGTWAERKHIMQGDIIFSINGEDLQEMSKERFKELLPTRPLVFGVDPPDTPSGSEDEDEKKARLEREQMLREKAKQKRQSTEQKQQSTEQKQQSTEQKQQSTEPASDLKEKRHTLRHDRRETRQSIQAIKQGAEDVRQSLIQDKDKVDVKEKRHTLRHDRRETRKSLAVARQSVIQAPLQEDQKEDAKKDTDQASVDSDLAREVVANEEDRPLGMGFKGLPPGVLEVTNVKSGTWAHRQQIQTGDLIVAVNDEDLEEMTKERFKELFAQRPLRLIIDPPDTPEGSEDEQEKRERDLKQREDAKEKARREREAANPDVLHHESEEKLKVEVKQMQQELRANRRAEMDELKQKEERLIDEEQILQRERKQQVKTYQEAKDEEQSLEEEIRLLKWNLRNEEKAAQKQSDELESELYNEASVVDVLEGRLRAAQRYRMRHNMHESISSHSPDELQDRLVEEETKVYELQSMLKAEAGALRAGVDGVQVDKDAVDMLLTELKAEQQAYKAEQNSVRSSLRVQEKAVEQAVERERAKFEDSELQREVQIRQLGMMVRSEEQAMKGMLRNRQTYLEAAEMSIMEEWEQDAGVAMSAEKAAARGLTRLENQVKSRLQDVEQEATFVDKYYHQEERQLRKREELVARKEEIFQSKVDKAGRKSFVTQVNDQIVLDSLEEVMAKDRAEIQNLKQSLLSQEAQSGNKVALGQQERQVQAEAARAAASKEEARLLAEVRASEDESRSLRVALEATNQALEAEVATLKEKLPRGASSLKTPVIFPPSEALSSDADRMPSQRHSAKKEEMVQEASPSSEIVKTLAQRDSAKKEEVVQEVSPPSHAGESLAQRHGAKNEEMVQQALPSSEIVKTPAQHDSVMKEEVVRDVLPPSNAGETSVQRHSAKKQETVTEDLRHSNVGEMPTQRKSVEKEVISQEASLPSDASGTPSQHHGAKEEETVQEALRPSIASKTAAQHQSLKKEESEQVALAAGAGHASEAKQALSQPVPSKHLMVPAAKAQNLAMPTAAAQRASGASQVLRRSHGPVYFDEQQEEAAARVSRKSAAKAAPAARSSTRKQASQGPIYFNKPDP